jgi:hypothetical protein
MIRRTIAIALAGTLLAACQNASPQMGMRSAGPAATAMDGSWASTDGVFVASFQGGNFTSRFTRTNEILAQGRYSVSGSQVNMSWLSVATQQERSAACTISGSDTVRCSQAGGGGFDLKRA